MTSAPAALSPVATTVQDGSFFQAGGPDASPNAPPPVGGRGGAAISAPAAAGRSAAKASRNSAGLTASSTAVSPSGPAGYLYCTRAAPRMLSLEPLSTSFRFSPSSVAKAAL